MPAKGVSTYTKHAGGVIYLCFRLKGQQRRVSSESTNKAIADRIADEISLYLYSDVLPEAVIEKFHERTKELLDVESEAVVAYRDARKPRLKDKDTFDKLPADLSKMHDHPELKKVMAMEDDADKVLYLAQKYFYAIHERDKGRKKIAIYKGERRRMGLQDLKDESPLPLSNAVKKFLDAPDGTSAKGEWRGIISDWCTRLAREIGETTTIQDLTAKQVIEHILSKKPGTHKKLTHNLCMFLTYVSNGQFDTRAVKKAVLENLEAENEEWYWLTTEQANGIIKNIAEQDDGRYWADAATLAYGTGVLPEELAMLQSSRASTTESFITVDRIFNGKLLVRGVKTLKSVGKVLVPNFAADALKRRVEAGEFLLFPRYDRFHMTRGEKKKRTAFETEHKLWESASKSSVFSSAFLLPRLRKGAEAYNAEQKKDTDKIDMKKLDSRIFRRTCARELILKYGFERAAAVIRDNVETLRKHYADLQSSDTSTER